DAVAGRKELRGLLDPDVRGEYEDADLRELAPDRPRRVEPSVVCVGGIRMSTIASSGLSSCTSSRSLTDRPPTSLGPFNRSRTIQTSPDGGQTVLAAGPPLPR